MKLPPLTSWKIRPWTKWFLYPLLAFPVVIPLLIVASVIFSVLGNRGDYAQGKEMMYKADLRYILRDFRENFHDHPDALALTLDELYAKNLLSGQTAICLGHYAHEFVPATPQTADDAVLLTIHGPRPEPVRFTKRDLTADPTAPDHLPEPSPAPSPVP